MPIFVKEGSVIPMQPVMQYTDELPLDTLILAIYPSSNKTAGFVLYEDDGATLEYQSGSFAETSIEQFFSAQSVIEINIGASIGSFQGKLSNRTYLSEVHLIGDLPTSVYKNGFPVVVRSSYQELRSNSEGYFYDNASSVLYVQIEGSTDSSYQITAEGIILSIDENAFSQPDGFVLEQNYPNPFNPTTKIRFTIAAPPNLPQGEAFVTLKVYDVLGNEVATLVDEELPAGNYEVEFSSRGLINQNRTIASGVYFYQLKASDPLSSSGQDFIQTKKMVLLR